MIIIIIIYYCVLQTTTTTITTYNIINKIKSILYRNAILIIRTIFEKQLKKTCDLMRRRKI